MIDLIHPLNIASRQTIVTLINLTWQSSLLILSVWLLIKVFRIKQARLRYRLWMLALIGTVLSFPLSLVAGRAGVRRLNLNPMPTAIALLDNKPTSRAEPASINYHPLTIDQSPSPIVLVDWKFTLPFSLWLCGVLILTVRLVIAHRRIIVIRRMSHPVTDRKIITMFNELITRGYNPARFWRPGKKPVILCSEGTSAPITIGVFRPAIILPANFSELFSVGELRSILAHELAHVQRCDYLIGVLQRLIQTILFFHPLVWYVCRQLNVECEHICDDSVVEVTGDSLVYARALLKLAERFNATPLFLSFSPHALRSKTQTRRRIERILDDRREVALSSRNVAMSFILGAVMLLGVSSSRVVVEGTERDSAIEQAPGESLNVVSDFHGGTKSTFAFRSFTMYGRSEDKSRSSGGHTRSPGHPSSDAGTTGVKVIRVRFTCCGRTSIRLIYVPVKSNPWDLEDFWQGGVSWKELFQ